MKRASGKYGEKLVFLTIFVLITTLGTACRPPNPNQNSTSTTLSPALNYIWVYNSSTQSILGLSLNNGIINQKTQPVSIGVNAITMTERTDNQNILMAQGTAVDGLQFDPVAQHINFNYNTNKAYALDFVSAPSGFAFSYLTAYNPRTNQGYFYEYSLWTGSIWSKTPVGNYPSSIALVNSGTAAYITDPVANRVFYVNFAKDNQITSYSYCNQPYFAIPNQEANQYLYLLCLGKYPEVEIINATSHSDLADLNLPSIPSSMSVDQTSQYAFVALPSSGYVEELNLLTGKLIQDISLSNGSKPESTLPIGNNQILIFYSDGVIYNYNYATNQVISRFLIPPGNSFAIRGVGYTSFLVNQNLPSLG